jgi:hypothetical protein
MIKMNDKLEQLAIKRLLKEYSFLVLDDEYKKEVISTGKAEFMKMVHDMRGDTPPPTSNEISEQTGEISKKPKIDPSTVDPKVREKVKKLYREIAKLTHPDKTNSEQHVELYTQATEAMEEFDLMTLYNICDTLNISYTLGKEDKDVLKEHIKNKKEKLSGIENSFIWIFMHEEEEIKREQLVKLFIEKHGNKL